MTTYLRRRLVGRSTKIGFTLVELLVVIAIIGILIALLLPAVQAAREAARRSQCTNNLKQIALAIHNYHDVYKTFPPTVGGILPTGNYTGCQPWQRSTGLSWRVMILPFIEQTPLYDKINVDILDHSTCYDPTGGFPRLGDSDPAGTPGSVLIDAFLCPSDPTRQISTSEPGTNYPGIWGDRAVLSADRGIFANREVRMRDVIDGTSNTAMVGEVFRGKQHIRFGGTPVTYDRQRCRRWSEETAWCGAATGYNDGTAWVGIAPNDPRPDYITWNDLWSVGGGNTERRPISSMHPGGAQCAYGDASVHFIAETVDGDVWRNTGSRNGGEPNTYSP